MRQKALQVLIGSIAFAPRPSFAAAQCEGFKAVSGATECSDTGLLTKLNTVIDTLFVVVGAITVLILIMGGIRYITSTGDAKRIQAAKDTILYAVIGLIVVILARAIVGFVIGKIA